MIRNILPNSLFIPLFGDRVKYGKIVIENDPDWIEWQKDLFVFYEDTQKQTGKKVNDWGFQIIRNVDFSSKTICELGPGIIDHVKYFKNSPSKYYLVDKYDYCLEKSEEVLNNKLKKIEIEKIKVEDAIIPLPDNSIDIILTFHQLEHIVDIDFYLTEIKRVLKPDGLLIGSIPTEGSIAWGFGRYLTSRKYVQKNKKYNYDKIICWEHPNYVDSIKDKLENNFQEILINKKPFPICPLDFNLSFSFIYKNIK